MSFGYSRRHRADLTLLFAATSRGPAIVFSHNYHEHGVHYRGHDSNGCPRHDNQKQQSHRRRCQLNQRDTTFFRNLNVDPKDLHPFTFKDAGCENFDNDTMKMDAFKKGLAAEWSMVRPEDVLFLYTVSTACDYFHGRQLKWASTDEMSPHTSLEPLL